MPRHMLQVEGPCLVGKYVYPSLIHHRESTHCQADASSASHYRGSLRLYLSFSCTLQWISVCLPTKGLSLHSGSGAHPSCPIKNFTPLPPSPFPFIYLSFSLLLISACTGVPIAPVLKKNLFEFHILLRLLQVSVNFLESMVYNLLNILPDSPSLLIPFHLKASVSTLPDSGLSDLHAADHQLLIQHLFLAHLRWHRTTFATTHCFLFVDTFFFLDVHALLYPGFPQVAHISPLLNLLMNPTSAGWNSFGFDPGLPSLLPLLSLGGFIHYHSFKCHT